MDKQNKPKVPVRIWLLYLLICSFVVSGVTLSKYITTTGSNDGARVAKFSFDASEDEAHYKVIDLNEIQRPGDSKTVILNISNKDAKGISEVAEQYTVSLKPIGSLPLAYTITSDITGFSTITHNASKISGEYSFSGEFPPSAETKHFYRLDIEWPISEKDSKYSSGSGISSLVISITGEQID